MKRLGSLILTLLVGAACATVPSSRTREWMPIVLWQGNSPIVRVATGHPDPNDRNLQAIGVEEAGGVIVAHLAHGALASSSRIHTHAGRLTGLAVADLDPAVPGEEIYAGGYAKGETGGAVIQLVLTNGAPRVRIVFTGDAFVHAVEKIAPAAKGGASRLLVTTYAGEVFVLTPAAGDGEWPKVLVHREPKTADPEVPKIKDVAVLARVGGGPQEVFIAAKGGRGVVLDPDRPGSARLVLEEDGGLSRAVADRDGGVFVVGYKGRVVHLVRRGDGFEQRVVYVEPDAGWRGVALGRFPVTGGNASLAVYGYGRFCRALAEKDGTWQPATLFEDSERGHSLVAADLVPGNGADELLLGSYSNRMIALALTGDAR